MKTKSCPKCKQVKPCVDFFPNRCSPDGFHIPCRRCCNKQASEWRETNREKYNKIAKNWAQSNPEKVKVRCKKYYKNNKQKALVASAAWARDNPGKVNAISARRHAAKLQATPPWVDLKEIEAIYIEAARLGLTVDHEVPLQGKGVRGLHVPWNLQLLTQSANSSKGNSWEG